MSNANKINRNDFVKLVLAFFGTVMGGVVGLPAIGYLISPATKSQKGEAWIPVGTLDSYEVGVPKFFSFTRSQVNGWEKTVNSFGVYVIKKSDTEATVFSNKCTHLSCRVTWHEDVEEYVCPCHDGHFDQQGNVIAGPPPTPLKTYETKLENGTMYIHLVEG